MNGEMQLVWAELLQDFSNAAILWQLAIIAASLSAAWLISGLLRAYVMTHAQESWKVGIGGFNRVLFPLSSLSFVYIGSFVLHHWQHVSLLTLVIKLMWAMAAIRLCVYALRYIFNPVGWVRAMEHIISRTIWVVLALHLTGFWPDLLSCRRRTHRRVRPPVCFPARPVPPVLLDEIPRIWSGVLPSVQVPWASFCT